MRGGVMGALPQSIWRYGALFANLTYSTARDDRYDAPRSMVQGHRASILSNVAH